MPRRGRFPAMSATDDLLVITPSDDGLIVTGEIDAHTAPTLAESLAGSGAGVRLDMSGVQFVDSSGLRVLIEAHQRAEESGGQLTIANPSDAVRRLLEISGVSDFLVVD